MALGTLLGTIGGAALGSIIPGAGTALGASIGAGIGGSIEGIAKERKAKNLLPPPNDYMEANFLGELDRMRKSFDTGSAYTSQLRELRNIQAATNQGIISAAGGQTGAAITGLARTSASMGDAYGKIAAEGEKRMDMYNQMYGSLLGSMAQRRAELQLMQYGQQKQQSAELRKSGLNTLMQLASLGIKIPGGGGGIGGDQGAEEGDFGFGYR